MVVLGISGATRDAAAALAVDGRIVAAASEDSFLRVPGIGYRLTGGWPFAAIAACLGRAKLAPRDVTTIVCASGTDTLVADDAKRSAGLQTRGFLAASDPVHIPSQTADAAQAAALWPGEASVVLVLDADGAEDGAVFVCRPGSPPSPVGPIAGWRSAIIDLAGRLGGSCGLQGGFSEAFGHQASLAPQGGFAGLGDAVAWDMAAGFRIDQAALAPVLAAAGIGEATSPGESDILNVRVLDARRALAAGLEANVVSAVAQLVRSVGRNEGTTRVAFGGSFFANSHVNTALWREFDEPARVAPVPEAGGRALGAALYPGVDPGAGLAGVAVGPEFTEQEIKIVLDNCRLDYLYDPHWEKLIRRVSALLARGKVVGWFQGPMEFGPRSLGGRSVLADPSDRFARDNILKYLKQQDHEESLALSIRDCDAEECLVLRLASPHMLLRAHVMDAWRNRFRAALDHEQTCRVHTVTKDAAPALWDLLRVHRERWGGAGFLNTNLSGVDEPTACTPRDAIRTFYSSSIDALVMGRFLLMKDYWLLRSDAE